jgi:hypothetical protein
MGVKRIFWLYFWQNDFIYSIVKIVSAHIVSGQKYSTYHRSKQGYLYNIYIPCALTKHAHTLCNEPRELSLSLSLSQSINQKYNTMIVATLLLCWSYRYKYATVVITHCLTVTKYPYLKWQWVFYFYHKFSFLFSITDNTFTGLDYIYEQHGGCLIRSNAGIIIILNNNLVWLTGTII